MTEKYWAFKAYNTETMYGFGTKAEASKYQDHLNEDRTINHYGITPVKDPATVNGIEFNIGDELQSIKDGR